MHPRLSTSKWDTFSKGDDIRSAIHNTVILEMRARGRKGSKWLKGKGEPRVNVKIFGVIRMQCSPSILAVIQFRRLSLYLLWYERICRIEESSIISLSNFFWSNWKITSKKISRHPNCLRKRVVDESLFTKKKPEKKLEDNKNSGQVILQ